MFGGVEADAAVVPLEILMPPHALQPGYKCDGQWRGSALMGRGDRGGRRRVVGCGAGAVVMDDGGGGAGDGGDSRGGHARLRGGRSAGLSRRWRKRRLRRWREEDEAEA